MTTKTLGEAAMLTGFTPELLLKLVRYAPKYGESRKLKRIQTEPVLFDLAELLDFKEYLNQPWNKSPSAKRPTIPAYIVADVKAESHHACAICGDMNNGELAHIEAVSDTFNNSPDNLLLLCPNHHTAYDHGHKASNVNAEVVHAAKVMKRDSRRRTLL